MDNPKRDKKEVLIKFVIPDGSSSEEDCNDCMKMAYQECVEAKLSPKWIKEESCLDVVPSKNSVFVMQEFSGSMFDKLRKTKGVRVVGPMCMRSCISEGLPIPDNSYPVFTTAMRNVILTASQVSVEVKKDIREKVGFMGGIYINNLIESATHLVTNAVRSAKYEAATQRGITVMVVDWVEAVWRLSKEQNVKATDPELIKKYKCPIFLNMFITCSNLSRSEKEHIKKLITDNGGTFTPQMRQQETTLLVVKEPRGEKYTHARSWGLPCVKPSYIIDSVKAGYTLPSEPHLITPSVSASTPTKEEDLPNFTCSSEGSISCINLETSKTSIEDTQMTNISMASQRRPLSRPPGSQYAQTLNNLTVSDAKKAGTFMDGVKIYLSGFTPPEGEKLTRILSLGGATLFPELCDSVSHILVGEFVIQDMKALTTMVLRPHVVTLEWLMASINQRSPAPEEPFYCLETRRVVPEPPSPLSQKGMQLLQPPPAELSETSRMPPPPEPACRRLFSEFMKENVEKPDPHQSTTSAPPATAPSSSTRGDVTNTSASTVASQETVAVFFEGLKFVIGGFDSNVSKEIEFAVEAAGGHVVATNFIGVADYAVVPLLTAVPNITAIEIVTNLWLEDCLDNGQVMEIQYYHQPLTVDTDRSPLAGCCVSLSNYFAKEKMFLAELAQVLGATYQDVFARVAKQEKGVMPSTHLVCPKPDGQKYKASVRWGLPAVTKDWLLACARQATRLDEALYLVDQQQDSSDCSVSVAPAPAPAPATTTTQSTPVMTTAPEPTTTPSTPLVTPVHRAVKSLKRQSSAMTPDDQSPFHVSTPDSPYGQVFKTPTDSSKKRWKRYIDSFPSKPTPPPSKANTKRMSTPLTEIKRQIWRTALELSNENVSPNYSIEEMDGNQDNEGQMEITSERVSCKEESVLHGQDAGSNASISGQDCRLDGATSGGNSRRNAATPAQDSRSNAATPAQDSRSNAATPARDSRSHATTPARDSRSNATTDSGLKSSHSKRPSFGRATPTVNDFRPESRTPSATDVFNYISSSTSQNSSSKAAETSKSTPDLPKKSPENERVCEMLEQMHRRMSISNNGAGEPQPLPQRELVTPPDTDAATQKPVISSLLPESQPILIGWDDPVEAAERAKVLGTTPPSTTSSSFVSKRPRKFVFSNVTEKDVYEARVAALGETVLSGTMYDSDTTHLIMDRPIRSEKLLCCLASGKWILHTSFIDAMVANNGYLPEEEKYEWGNPASSTNLPPLTPSSLEDQLAGAAMRWRQRLSCSSDGAFTGMKAIIVVSTPNKYESYKRLVLAGGGDIVPPTALSEATHCFVDPNKLAQMPVPLSQLVSHRVPCLPPLFLGETLTKFPPPQVEDSVIPQYRKLLN